MVKVRSVYGRLGRRGSVEVPRASVAPVQEPGVSPVSQAPAHRISKKSSKVRQASSKFASSGRKASLKAPEAARLHPPSSPPRARPNQSWPNSRKRSPKRRRSRPRPASRASRCRSPNTLRPRSPTRPRKPRRSRSTRRRSTKPPKRPSTRPSSSPTRAPASVRARGVGHAFRRVVDGRAMASPARHKSSTPLARAPRIARSSENEDSTERLVMRK